MTQERRDAPREDLWWPGVDVYTREMNAWIPTSGREMLHGPGFHWMTWATNGNGVWILSLNARPGRGVLARLRAAIETEEEEKQSSDFRETPQSAASKTSRIWVWRCHPCW